MTKKALLIGEVKLFSIPEKILNVWFCWNCGNQFNALKKLDKKKVICPCCKEIVELYSPDPEIVLE